ncbi:hypothetical protein [Alteromonas sp.]|uniref:hypothetical protein n=1 Tax=Alteromonas sp. TaxID=232 RepID=UPI00257A91A9|nr:hypothetical protein [Alteromonas sp.]|tara:strand:- start:32865 stop:33026 length:162 start_codon:yes stop_codon:yes gene_type:complete
MIEDLIYFFIAAMLFVPLLGTLRGEADMSVVHTVVLLGSIVGMGAIGLLAMLV